ncbi:regulatory iron-sulfur-containing complex subunit RicT [Microbacter margulisiae]|uniref:Cell fate regulator YaaT (PSP1 superfamily) n=1 Tax=Microbacter margulisiae TaxID=1350067 RepID=A0A7W5DRC6_9PORP|nr:cell fate regulator YaaT (PSP1 superfamily) [Microbacter margulisiae]
MDYILLPGGFRINKKGTNRTTDKKLSAVDWMCDLPETHDDCPFVEVQFKNTRKGYYLNSNQLKLEKGDMVAVEATPGHDIGEVTLTGRLVEVQMQKNGINTKKTEIRRVYRKARPIDIEKYEEAKAKEHDTMIRTRRIAADLNLNMKIGDVEYQGDGNKAIFYYIADERVDFRQLIKVLAEEFGIRIEMRQIGARQEAGRIGGIGPCGRELCCSTWMGNFVSVATNAARYQDLSTNPQKLAGQCAKLKCCINYELDSYMDVQKDFPSKDIPLEALTGTYYHFKTDVFKRQMTYSSAPGIAANLVVLSVDRVKEILALNRKGEKVGSLEEKREEKSNVVNVDFQNVVGQDSVTRFDPAKKKKHKSRNKKHGPANRPQSANS